MSDEWTRRNIVPIYKNNGDVQNFEIIRGLNLWVIPWNYEK